MASLARLFFFIGLSSSLILCFARDTPYSGKDRQDRIDLTDANDYPPVGPNPRHKPPPPAKTTRATSHNNGISEDKMDLNDYPPVGPNPRHNPPPPAMHNGIHHQSTKDSAVIDTNPPYPPPRETSGTTSHSG